MKKSVFSIVFFLLSFALVNGQEIPPVDTANIAWSPDGQYIAVATKAVVNVLDAESLEVVNSFSVSNDIRNSTPLAWSPDGQRIAFSNRLSNEIWHQPSSNALLERSFSFNVGTFAFAWHPSKSILVIADGESTYFWDTVTWTEIHSVALGLTSRGIYSLDWDEAGDKLLIGNGRFIGIFNYNTHAIETILRISPFLNRFQEYINPVVNRAVWSPFEEEIAVVSDNAVRVVNVADFEGQDSVIIDYPSFYGHEGAVFSVAWHPSGDYLASSGEDSTIRVWNVEAGVEIHQIELPENTFIRSVVWSPDGSQLVYGAPNGEAELVFVDSSEFLPSED